MRNRLLYAAVLEAEEEGGYSVSFPDLDGCFTCGDTFEEAMDMAHDAARGWIAIAARANEPLPQPTPVEKVVADYPHALVQGVWVRTPLKGKRLELTLDADLFNRIDRAATSRQMNRNDWVRQTLGNAIAC